MKGTASAVPQEIGNMRRVLAPGVRLLAQSRLSPQPGWQGKLVQFPILGAGLFEDGYSRVSIFPKQEEILVSCFSFGLVSS
jgi:hypothetical protein